MPHLSLSLLGPFQVTLDGQPVTGFESSKVRSLLAYLVVEAHRPHPRETLAGLLWPDRPNQTAYTNLRHVLANLRQAIGDPRASPPFLLITRDAIQFNAASDYTLDVETLARQIADDHSPREADIRNLQTAVSQYRGSFLEGFVSDSRTFEEWALFKREQINQQMQRALRRLTVYHEGRGEYEQAATYARRQLELEPWDEAAHQNLMRMFAFTGQRSLALAQYETCRRWLKEELGIEPSCETKALYESLRDGTLVAGAGKQVSDPISPTLPSFLRKEPIVERARPVFVAQERELARLDEFLNLALGGQGQVVFVTGDPGSGKTALVHEFVRRAMAAHDDLITAFGNGNAHTGIGDPYSPFIEILQMLTGDIQTRWAGGAITREHAIRLWRLLPTVAQALVDSGPDLVDRFVPGAALMAHAQAFALGVERAVWRVQLDELIGRKAAIPPAQISLQQTDLFEQYTQVLQSVARRYPLMLVLDDLQWVDAGSTSLLFHLGRKLAGSRIFIIGAYRPGDVTLRQGDERHPLETVVNEFQRNWGDIFIDLTQSQGRQFVNAFLDIEPNCLGKAFRETLYQHTGGHPLFTVELLRGLQERGDLKHDAVGQWIEGQTLNWDSLPARIEAVIAERIGRLPERWQTMLAVASVEGHEFSAEVIAHVQETDERQVIRHLSGELARQHQLVSATSSQRIGDRWLSRYRFRHYLYQKYLYNHVDIVERAHLHRSVGQALEMLYGELTGEMTVQLAWHFQEAGIAEKAIGYLRQAGERAVRLSAHLEAITHFKQALDLLGTLPDSPQCTQQELGLQIGLATSLLAIKGYGDEQVGQAYARAQELCQQLGDAPQLFLVSWMLALYNASRAEHKSGRVMMEQLLSIGERAGDPTLIAVAHWGMGWGHFWWGEPIPARSHLEYMIRFYNPQQHHTLALVYGQDPGVACRSALAEVLWALGYPEQALRQSREAIVLARNLSDPFSLTLALGYASLLQAASRDFEAVHSLAEECIRLSAEHGFSYWLATGTFCRGWGLAAGARGEEGISYMRQGLTTTLAIGVKIGVTHHLAELAAAYAKIGQVDQGLSLLTEALEEVLQSGERHYEAEIHRLMGELLLMQQEGIDEAEAEKHYWRAIEVARQQSAKSWELRAMMSLCRLWHRQGKSLEARQMLQEAYGWFTEGFDTPDLQDARALLDLLSGAI